jgi:hypothetical protein
VPFTSAKPQPVPVLTVENSTFENNRAASGNGGIDRSNDQNNGGGGGGGLDLRHHQRSSTRQLDFCLDELHGAPCSASPVGTVTISCNLGNMANGASASLTITVKLNGSGNKTSISNTAILIGSDCFCPYLNRKRLHFYDTRSGPSS